MRKFGSNLPPKVEAVLIRLGRSASLNVTQAVKLPYLVDVVANHALGQPITEGTHQAWNKGVVTQEVWHYLRKAQDSTVLHLEPVRWSEEEKVIIDVAPAEGGLTPEELQIVDFVASEFGQMKAGELGRLTKLMNPQVSTWGSNKRADLSENAFERLGHDYQAMAEEVASLTLEQLRATSEPVEDIEDAIA